MAADTKAVTAQTLKQIMDLLEATCGGELNIVLHILNEIGECSTLSSLPPQEVVTHARFVMECFEDPTTEARYLGSVERD